MHSGGYGPCGGVKEDFGAAEVRAHGGPRKTDRVSAILKFAHTLNLDGMKVGSSADAENSEEWKENKEKTGELVEEDRARYSDDGNESPPDEVVDHREDEDKDEDGDGGEDEDDEADPEPFIEEVMEIEEDTGRYSDDGYIS